MLVEETVDVTLPWDRLPEESRAKTRRGVVDTLALLETLGYRSFDDPFATWVHLRRRGEVTAVRRSATWTWRTADGTAADTGGHGFWLPLLPPTHIAGVQVIARAHRTAQVLGLDAPALPDPLPEPTDADGGDGRVS